MCERYVIPEPAQAEWEFGVVRRWWAFSPSYNLGPLRSVPVSTRSARVSIRSDTTTRT